MEYQSPGAAFSNAVEAHMAQTAMMKRQAMLDELARKKEERQAKAQDEEMEIRRDEAESRKAEFHQKIGEQKTAGVRKWISELVPGDIPTPDMLKEAQEVGLGDQNFPVGPPESGTGGSLAREGATPEDVGGMAGEALSFARTAGQRPFIGSPQQRDKITSDKKQEDYINALPEGPLKAAALYELKTNRTMPAVAAAPKDAHSADYVAHKDYEASEIAAGRKPLGLNEWANMDANRKKPSAGSNGVAEARAATRRDQVYNRAITEIDKMAAEPEGHLNGINQLGIVLNEKTIAADALVAPLVLKATVAGTGSGFRMTRAEIDNVLHSRSAWQDLEAKLSKWSLDPSKALLLPDDQRGQLRALAKAIRVKAMDVLHKINKGRHELDDTDDPREIQKITTRIRQSVFGLSDEAVGGGNRVYYDKDGNPVRE